MTVTPALTVLSVLFGLPLLVGGAIMIWFGARLRSRGGGKEPHCRRCGYLLRGITSANCPECGSALTLGNVVQGARRRRPGLALGGVALLLLGVVAAIPFAQSIYDSFPWYHMAPTFWVIRDLRSPSKSVEAMEELLRRDKDGDLSLAQQQAIADVGLAVQAGTASGSVDSDLVEYTGKLLLAGRLTDAQRSQFGKQSIRLTLHVRPRVRLGERVPFEVKHATRVQGGGFWVNDEFKRIEIDGKVIEEYPDGKSSGGLSGLGAGGGSGNSVTCKEPGDHELAVTSHAILSQGEFGKADSREPLFQQDIRMTAKFHVIAPGETDEFTAINDPALSAQLRECIAPAQFYWTPDDWILHGEFQMRNLPANVAFSVFVRVDGREVNAGSGISGTKGSPADYIVGARIAGVHDPKPATVDFILRTDEKAARNTVDEFDVWKGELVYENVPVKAKKE